MVMVCCWTGCGRTALGLGVDLLGWVALGVLESRVWRRARVWAAVRIGGVGLGLGLVGGTAMMREYRWDGELDGGGESQNYAKCMYVRVEEWVGDRKAGSGMERAEGWDCLYK